MPRTILALTAIALLAAPGLTHAQPKFAPSFLSGAQEVPPVTSPASGTAKLKFAKDLSSASVSVKMKNLVGFTMAHLHCGLAGTNGPVVASLSGDGCTGSDDAIDCELTNDEIVSGACGSYLTSNLAALAFAARDGLIYYNVHTVTNPAGELRGQVLSK